MKEKQELYAYIGSDGEEDGILSAVTDNGTRIPLVFQKEDSHHKPIFEQLAKKQAEKYGLTVRLKRFESVEDVGEPITAAAPDADQKSILGN